MDNTEVIQEQNVTNEKSNDNPEVFKKEAVTCPKIKEPVTAVSIIIYYKYYWMKVFINSFFGECILLVSTNVYD